MLTEREQMHRVLNAIKLACFLCLFSPFAKAQVETPVLIDGQSPQVVLHEKFRSQISGFRIFQFRVRQDGSIDNNRITSRAINRDEEEFKHRIDYADYASMGRMKFKPLTQDTWVQCKIYTSFYSNLTKHDLNQKEKADHFKTFNDALIKNEIDTYFRDEKTGKELEYIVRNGWIIFAPTHLIATS